MFLFPTKVQDLVLLISQDEQHKLISLDNVLSYLNYFILIAKSYRRSTVSPFFLLLYWLSLFCTLFREIMGTEELWPYLLAVSGIPAILQFVTLLFFPEAPRYLYIDKGDTEGCKKGEQTPYRFTNIFVQIWFHCRNDF